MAAGKISLWFNGPGYLGAKNPGGNLHLVHLDPNTSAPYEHIQPPNNKWSVSQAVPNPDQIAFQAIKLVQGVGSVVMLIGLDRSGANNSGRLWYTTSNDNGGWATNFTRLPNIKGYDFSSFDAVSIPNIGIVVAAVVDGSAYTQGTPDGVTWSQPGWSNQPASRTLYSTEVFQGAPLVSFTPSVPLACTTVVTDNNGQVPVYKGLGAPVIAGLSAIGNNLGVPGYVFPVVLYNDPTNSNWQWSQVPSKAVNAAIYPPYPVRFSDMYFGPSQLDISPILLLLGIDGNIYFIIATNGDVSNWTYYEQGALPNPSGLFFTKAKVAMGYIVNPNGAGNLQVVAINKEDQFPYLIWQNGVVPDPTQGNWNFYGQLPPLNPAKQVADFDIAVGISALQVAYLATDGTVFINYQVQSGEWAAFGPL